MPPRTIPLRPESWSSDSLKCIASSKVIWGGRVGTSVGHRFDNHRTLGCKGLVPRGSDLLGLIHADTRKAQHLSVAGELEIRHILTRLELRRLPESVAIMPRRIFRSRANQFAELPLSDVRMQFSGRRGESSQNTR